MSSRFKFPRRVRIHGGECGAVARALHHAAQKGALVQNEQSLITNEKAFLSQADLKKAFGSTFIERKQMSTKTTIKRVALIAVSALGFGLMTVVPAKADNAGIWCEVADGLSDGTGANTTCYGVAGVANTVTIQVDAAGSAANDRIVVSGASAKISSESANGTISADGSTLTIADESSTFTVTTPSAGTITISAYTLAAPGIYAATAYETVTVTVNATALAGTLDASKTTSVIDGSTDGDDAGAVAAFGDNSVDESITASNLLGAGQAAAILVSVFDGTNAALDDKAISATIDGPGLLGINATEATVTTAATGRQVSIVSTDGDNDAVVTVWADQTGTGGTSTVKIYQGTTLIATETLKFYGAVKTLTATQLIYALDDDAALTSVVKITAVDANGVAVPIGQDDGAVVETATALVVDAISDLTNGTGVDVKVDPTDAKFGAKAFTWKHTATGVTVSGSVMISEATASNVAITFDKQIYQPGELMTVTVSATDSGGRILPDGDALLLKDNVGITSNVNLVGSTLPSDETVGLVNGKKSYTVYAPLVSGTITLSATEGTATASTTKAAITATATVGQTATEAAADAATEAAVEATDAANQAYEAAVVATETAEAAVAAAEDAKAAAEEATAAVEALATQVSTMIAKLEAQLSALAKTVAKILKKV